MFLENLLYIIIRRECQNSKYYMYGYKCAVCLGNAALSIYSHTSTLRFGYLLEIVPKISNDARANESLLW